MHEIEMMIAKAKMNNDYENLDLIKMFKIFIEIEKEKVQALKAIQNHLSAIRKK